MSEAAKLVIWPRETKTIDGKPVYWYSVVGIVMTNKPLDFPNESLVMGSTDGQLTQAISELIAEASYEPPYPMGDAGNVLVSLGDLSPDNCEKL